MSRISSAAFVFLIILTSFGAVKQTEAATQCLQRNAQGVASEYIQSGQAYKDFANKAISCDKCSDERMDIKPSTFLGKTVGVTITSTLTRRCTPEELKAFDCKTTKRPGKLIYKNTANNSSYSISKCNPKLLSAISRSVDAEDTEGALLKQLALEEAGGKPSAAINIETAAGQKTLAGQLATAFQITPEEAQTIVAKDPEAALRAIYAVAQGDTEAVKTEAEALGLNPNLTDQVALNAKLVRDGNLTQPDEWEVVGGGDTTFREAARGAIADTLAPMCAQLGGCGEVCSRPNANQLTCGANNPGALTFTPWQAKYGGRPCNLPNNTTCYDTIEGGIAAQANLLTTSSRYFGTGNNTILGAFCNGYSTSNCSQYAAFISAQTGIPMNQTIDPKNSEQIAAIMMASSRFENGRGVIYTPEQLQKGLQVAFGGDRLPEGTNGYVPRTVYGTNGGTQFGSPFSSNAAAAPTNVGYGSAFGNAPPAPVAQQQSSYTQSTATPVSQPTSQQLTPSQTQTTSTGTSSVAQQLEDALKDPSAKSGGTQSPATLVAQPKEVKRGNPISVSWTSVGLSTDSPCVLRADSTVVAEGNQGTKIVQTTGATRLGSMIFTLACTTASGTTFQRTAAVMVR